MRRAGRTGGVERSWRGLASISRWEMYVEGGCIVDALPRTNQRLLSVLSLGHLGLKRTVYFMHGSVIIGMRLY